VREPEKQDVGHQLVDKRTRRLAIGYLAKDAEAWFGFEQTPQTLPENGVLAGNDQSDERGLFRHDYEAPA
jgi:hypothetical protein